MSLEGLQMELTVYLAGEIHSNWRAELKEKTKSLKLPLHFVGPMENHDRSDFIGEEILGEQPNAIFRDECKCSYYPWQAFNYYSPRKSSPSIKRAFQ